MLCNKILNSCRIGGKVSVYNNNKSLITPLSSSMSIYKSSSNNINNQFNKNYNYIQNRNLFNQIRNNFAKMNENNSATNSNNKPTTAMFDSVLDASDDRKIVDYIRILTKQSPKDGLKAIERGWERGKIPINEDILKEYFKAIGYLGKFDSLNLTSLLSILNKANIFGSEAIYNEMGKTPGLSLASLINGGSGSKFSSGGSPQDPLYMVQSIAEPSWKSQAWRLLKFSIGAFLIISFAGALLDEKTGGAGGLGSRLGMGSVVHQAEHSDKSFNDVVGIDEAKTELQEIVSYLKNPKKFTRLGGKLPKGVLLTGPPGTGKTLLARAIAGEAGVPFFYTSGSEFEEMYVGVGARRVRDLFEAAKAKSPCIIFIDEIDAIGGSRQLKDQSAMKMTLNQLLVEMDGFEQNNGVIVIAATNFPDSLDKALIRPGRLDKHVDVPMPDIGGRKAILELYGTKIPLNNDVNLEQIARGTPGFSGAELYNLINQAALKASIDGFKNVGMAALEYAKDKIMMGAERKSAVISKETMLMTAYHEGGHALVALKTMGSDPIHKATIMPRGRSLGMVMQLPDGDQTSYSRRQMLARLDICMGGRVAEELVYGHDHVTSGASSDIQQATRLAKAMVTSYGLSDSVGVMAIDDKSKISGETQKRIDDEIRKLLSDSYERATKIITNNRKELDIIAKGLMEYESLSGGEIVDIINGKIIDVKGLRSHRPSHATKELELVKHMKKIDSNSNGNVSNIEKKKPIVTTSAAQTPQSNNNLIATKNVTPNSKETTQKEDATTPTKDKKRGPPSL
jgi:ATP-dependent metalloprotease